MKFSNYIVPVAFLIGGSNFSIASGVEPLNKVKEIVDARDSVRYLECLQRNHNLIIALATGNIGENDKNVIGLIAKRICGKNPNEK